jgi:integrase
MITDRQARAIKPDSKTISSGIAGLTLQPTATKGRGKWVFRYVSPVTQKRRQTSFGVFPDVSVAKAIEQGRDARALLAGGSDPLEEKQARAAIPTFEEATRDYWAELRPSLKPSLQRDKWIRLMELHAFPKIGSRLVNTLTPQDFAAMLSTIWQGKAETARKVKQRSHKVMAVCWARAQVQANPVDVVQVILPPQKDVTVHQPAMPWQIVPAFVSEHLTRQPVLGSRAALLFTILTACRSGEVRGAKWQEIDLEACLWTVPASRMKASAEHRVPLSDAVVELLKEQLQGDDQQPDALVFPAIRGGLLTDTAVTMLLRKTNATSDTTGRVATAHGFRSSFRNWAADNKYSGDIAERALAHTIGNKVQAAYERTDRLEARVDMMEQWSRHVMNNASNVVAIGSARA